LVIEVHDTGTGLDEAATTVNRGTGFGLTQIRQRLTSTYGETAALELVCTPGSGTCATLTLPLEHAS
jgi:sensor histidine kinase YesM